MFLFLSTEIHTGIAIVPYMYNQADMGIYQESIRFEDGQLFCDEELQAEHAEFA